MKKSEEDLIDIISTAKHLGFSNKSFLITGATGMIGQNLVSALMGITACDNIIVLGKDKKEAEDLFGKHNCVCSSFDRLLKIQNHVDYIIHLASPTNSKFIVERPVETIDFIYSSTKTILDFAKKHNSKVLYISSMEVYGEVLDESIRAESDLGFVSLETTRSSYPETKRLCELLCLSYSKEYKIDSYSARLAQTFGAGTSFKDSRIFGYISRCIQNKEDIVLKTRGDSVGNYCYLSDTIKSFFYILAFGNPGETYNVVGDDNRSTILKMASDVAHKIAKDEIKVQIIIEDNACYPKPTLLNMSNKKLKKLGWIPKYNLMDMFERMIEDAK